MATWTDYKKHVSETNPEIGKDLADLCGLPRSFVARIESGESTPNLITLLKIFRELGLSLVVEPSIKTAPPVG